MLVDISEVDEELEDIADESVLLSVVADDMLVEVSAVDVELEVIVEE